MLFDKEKEYVKGKVKGKEKKLLNMNTEPFYK